MGSTNQEKENEQQLQTQLAQRTVTTCFSIFMDLTEYRYGEQRSVGTDNAFLIGHIYVYCTITVKALKVWPYPKQKYKLDMKVPVCTSPFVSYRSAHTVTSLFQVLKLSEMDQTCKRS